MSNTSGRIDIRSADNPADDYLPPMERLYDAALRKAGCDLVVHEVVSTRVKESDRQELQQALRSLIEGDEMVVMKLDHLDLSQVEVIDRLHSLRESGIHVRCLEGQIITRALG
tara:strand:- start:1451 stop:1789 length:339 start_codon:yes stop_codon:yes gene_type:complete